MLHAWLLKSSCESRHIYMGGGGGGGWTQIWGRSVGINGYSSHSHALRLFEIGQFILKLIVFLLHFLHGSDVLM